MATNQVKVEITAETKALLDGLAQATSAVKNATGQIEGHFGALGKVFDNLKAPIAAIAAAMGGGAIFGAAVSETVAFAKEAGALSRVLGTTARESAVLSTAIGDIYGNVDEFLGGAQKLVKTLVGNEAAIKGMGVATRDANGNFRAMPDLLADINGRLANFKEGSDRDAAAATVFGKGWRDMLRYIQLTPEVMDEARRKVDELGLSLGPEQAARVKAYRAAMNDVGDVFRALQVRVGAEVMPSLTALGEWFVKVAPGAINTVVGLLRAMTAVLSMKTVQLGLAVGALYLLRGGLVSLVGPLKTAGDLIRVQMALGAMQGVTGIQALGGALLSFVNPVTATIVVLGGAAIALERWATAGERSRKAFLDALPAMVQQVKTADTLAEKTKALGEAMDKGNLTEAQKKSTQRQLADIQNELIAMSPAYADALKGEAKNYREILDAIEKVNAAKKQELQTKRDAIALELAAGEKELAGYQANPVTTPVDARTGAGASTQYQANLSRATDNVWNLRQALAQADLALSKLTSSSSTAAETFTPKDSEGQFSKMKADLEAARYEFEATTAKAGQLVEWTRAMEVSWLEENAGRYTLNAKEKGAADKMLFEAKRAVLKDTHDAEIAEWEASTADYKADAESRLAIAESIAWKEAQVHGENSKEAAKARGKVAQVEAEIADQRAKVADLLVAKKQAAELAIIDLERNAIEARRSMNEISGEEAILALQTLEERKLDTEKAGLEARLENARLEPAARQEIQNQIDAIELRRTASRQNTGTSLKAEGQKTTIAGGLQAYAGEATRALEQWGTTAREVMQGVENAFAQSFANIFRHGQTAGQKVDALWQAIAGSVMQAIGQIIAKELVLWGVQKAIDVWKAASATKDKVQAGAEVAAAATTATAVVTSETSKTTAMGVGAAAAMSAAITYVSAAALMATAALDLAVAETWAAYAGIPFVGPGLAIAQTALIFAAMEAAMAMSEGIGASMAFAQGGIIDRPTLALMGEAGQRELVVPEMTFQRWATNLTGNILAEERKAQSYRVQAAGYPGGAQAGGSGQTVHVDLRGATILDSSTRGVRGLGRLAMNGIREAARETGVVLRPGSVLGGV